MITYQQASEAFSLAWRAGQKAAVDAGQALVDMLSALETEGYARTAAVNKICKDHEHLKGFSRSTLYRNLPIEFKRVFRADLPGREKLAERMPEPLPENQFGNAAASGALAMQAPAGAQLAKLQETIDMQAEVIKKLQSAPAPAQKVVLDCARFGFKINIGMRNGLKAILDVQDGAVAAVRLENEK